jgi:hypothetical protein
MALIDLSNYKTTLKQSTLGRGFSPNGNIFFDKVGGKIEFIYRDELATVNFGAGAVANPLIRADGIKFEAIYAFENQERAADEALRRYDRWTSGTFKFGGAYNFVKGRVPSTAADRAGIRGSGWNELDAAGVVTRTYFGNKGLSNIDASSQPYYQLSVGGTAVNFAKIGQIDEAVQVYGDGANGGFTSTSYEAVSVRTYGNNYDRKETTTDLGIAELGGYSTGFALNESAHLTTKTASHPFANVLTTPTGVWVGMQLNRIASPAAKTEFSDATGSRLFTWELLNPNGATLDQMVAWLDAFATSATKEADGLGILTGKLGKNIKTWYTYNAAGKVLTRSGVSSAEGLYLRSVPSSDQQRVVMLDDSGTIKSYSFSVSVEAFIGSVAKSDAKSWYHSFFSAAYNTTGAITVKASNAALVKGMSSAADVANKIIFAFDYTGDTFGGAAATPKTCVFLVEGDGGAVQEKVFYTITETTTVAFSCAPTKENNV